MKAGWQTKPFEDCIEKVTYTTKIQRKDFLEEGQFPIVSQEESFINGYWSDVADVFSVTTPVVVFGDHTKVLKYVDFDFVLGADGVKLLPPKGFLLPKFFYYQLQSVNLESLGYARHYKLLRELELRYPPLPEQQRIVTLIDEAFDGIATARAHAEKNLQNARELIGIGFQAITKSLGRTQWPIRQVESLAASRKGAMRTGPFGSQLLHSEFVDEGIAVLGIDNAVANEFRWDRRRYITKEKYQQMGRYRVFPGDVLITIMGTCGRCAVVPDDIPLAINTKHLCCITLNREKCLPEYLHIYFLHDLTARDYLTAHAKGSIMAGLNMGIISELPVRLPLIEVQAEIVERFAGLSEETQRLESLYQRKLTALDELKKSLLHRAFNGDL